MKVAVLASGSKGNCTYLETKSHHILIDMGTTAKYIEEKLRDMNIEPSTIDALFISHDHKDHISALNVFTKRYKPIVFMTEKLEEILMIQNYRKLDKENTLDELSIKTIKTSHDATDSIGFVFEENNESLVYITDTGYINSKYIDVLKNRTTYIMESNHDVEMLMNGKYRYDLKVRILGDRGHLSNEMSTSYLESFVGNKTKRIILAHLSEENNSEEIAYKTISDKIKDKQIIIAKQNERTDLMEV